MNLELTFLELFCTENPFGSQTVWLVLMSYLNGDVQYRVYCKMQLQSVLHPKLRLNVNSRPTVTSNLDGHDRAFETHRSLAGRLHVPIHLKRRTTVEEIRDKAIEETVTRDLVHLTKRPPSPRGNDYHVDTGPIKHSIENEGGMSCPKSDVAADKQHCPYRRDHVKG